MNKTIIIGSRGSDLALWQANHVQAQLAAIGAKAEITIIKTQGDQIQHLSFDKLEGKGFFTKEIEEALLAGSIDLAVHSHKDLPTTSPNGLSIVAVSDREDPSELLLIRKESVDASQLLNLKQGATVGTSSARRKSQMLSFRSDVQIAELRGNVPTRIQKLRDGNYDAILLAAAGVSRLKLDLSDLHVEVLDKLEFVPAPAQGVLALQIREADTELNTLLQKLNNTHVAASIGLERKILNLFDGGCQLPLGAYCKTDENGTHLWVSKAKTWDAEPVRLYKQFPPETPVDILKEATTVINAITNLQPCRVFISKDYDAQGFFTKTLQAHGYTVSASSLIETTTIPFSNVPPADWIFFSSSNAVSHFFSQQPALRGTEKYATIGKGTAATLKQHGKTPSFVGSNLHTQKTGRDFEAVAGNSSILFPQAKDATQSIQKELSFSAKVHNLYVYATTHLRGVNIPEADILVFTSPSNVRSFYENGNTIPDGKKVIAIGPTTGKELERQGVKNYHLPYASDEVALATAVFTASTL